jgi:hypothetical protein
VNVLAARSHSEAAVYVLMHDCRACGSSNRDVTDELDARDGDVFTEYTSFCRDCGNIDVHRFRLPAHDPLAGAVTVVFGGPEPSAIIDAGEWLAFARRTSGGGPVEPEGLTLQECADAALAMEAAAAAVREVVKFFEPDAERLPRSAIWTDRGRAEFDRDPWRFSRTRLAVVENAYREAAGRLGGRRPIWST